MLSWIIPWIMNSVVVAGSLSIIIFVILYMYKRNKGKPFEHKVSTFIFLYYSIVLFYITIYREGLFMNTSHRINLYPFQALLDSFHILAAYDMEKAYLFLVYNVLGNILWFVPFGYFIAFFNKKPSFLKVLFMSFGLSLLIETLQYFVYVGVSDIDDLIFNTIGGCLGYLAYRIIHRKDANYVD